MARLAAWRGAAAGLGLAGQLRCFTAAAAAAQSSGGVVDEMVGFARSTFKTNREQAVDVLKSGLQYMDAGPGAGRLYLAQAEIEADRNRWREVGDLARKAAAAASEAQPATPAEILMVAEVELQAECVAARAALAQGGRDADAFKAAQVSMEVARKSFTAAGDEDRRWQGLVLASSIAGLVQHASSEFVSAGESVCSVMQLAGDQQDQRGSSGSGSSSGSGPPPERDHLIGEALKQAAAFRLSEGLFGEAQLLAERAAAGLETALKHAKDSSDVLLSPVFTGEALADAWLTEAQAGIAAQAWEDAEATLSDALAAAESVSGESCVRVAFVLLMTAHLYSRTGRVTLAEGLYREASKMLQLSPATTDAVDIKTVHPSVGALLSWRYAQLLTALPRRGTEAAAWEKLARALHEEAPIGGLGSAPETAFGTLDALSGKGQVGRGVVLDLMCRRALPCQL